MQFYFSSYTQQQVFFVPFLAEIETCKADGSGLLHALNGARLMTGFSAEVKVDNWLLTPSQLWRLQHLISAFAISREGWGGGGVRVGIVNMSTIHDLSLAGAKICSPCWLSLLENCSSEGKLPINENVGIGNVSFLWGYWWCCFLGVCGFWVFSPLYKEKL